MYECYLAGKRAAHLKLYTCMVNDETRYLFRQAFATVMLRS